MRETVNRNFGTFPEYVAAIGVALEEGLFEKVSGITTKGYEDTYINISEDEGKEIQKGNVVEFVSGVDERTVQHLGSGIAAGIIRADPRGVPPTAEGMDLREATLELFQPGLPYHFELADDNDKILSGDIIVYDTTKKKFDKGTAPSAGYIFTAMESASENSGKVIDCLCVGYKFA